MKKTNGIYYFGYGAHVSPTLMKSLLGRVPKKIKAKLLNHRQYIQSWKAIPVVAQAKLIDYWMPHEFVGRYIVRPRRGYFVEGVVWIITEREKYVLDMWDLTDGTWTITNPSVVVLEDGNEVVAEVTYALEWNDMFDVPINAPRFLNNRKKMYAIASCMRQLGGIG